MLSCNPCPERSDVARLLYEGLTSQLIWAYYRAYNGLSRTYPEFICEGAMAMLLRRTGVPYRRQHEIQIFYKDRLVGVHRLDLLVDDKVVAELKVAEHIEKIHKAQLFSYLKATGKQVGLLFNFGSPQPEFERLFFDPTRAAAERPVTPPTVRDCELPAHLIHPELVGQILGAAVEVHRTLGPGFIYRIYANACYHEFRLRSIPVEARKSFQVIFEGEEIGELKFAHFIVEEQIMFFPVAIQHIEDINVNNLKDWIRAHDIKLGLMINFYETAIKPIFIVAQ